MGFLFLLINLIKETILIIIFVIIIFFCFNIRSNINILEDLKIQTNFIANYNNNNFQMINKIDYIYENNEINKYEGFFNKYHLKEGQTLNDNENIKSSFDNLYKLSLALIIILIILLIPSIFPFLLSCLIVKDEEGEIKECVECLSIYTAFGKIVILFILMWVYVGFFISYNNVFQNDFFDFYDSINNRNEQILFKNYYNSLFDLKTDLLINIIFIPINVIYCFLYILFYYDPCKCYREKCYK